MTVRRLVSLLSARFAVAPILAVAMTNCAGADDQASAPREDGLAARNDASPGQPDAGLETGATVSLRQRACRYDAYLATGHCANVGAVGGTWVAQPLFPDAPEDVRDVACSYRWMRSGTSAGTGTSAPDIAALRALHTEQLVLDCGPEPPCATCERPHGEVVVVSRPIPSPTGVTGCDVCGGRLRGNKGFLVLPPQLMRSTSTLFVQLEPSGFATFDLTPPASGAQSFLVELPQPPVGKTYGAGRISIW